MLTGSSEEVHPVTSLADLAKGFELAHLSRNAARFDEAELRALSMRTLHQLAYDAARDRLAALDIVGHKAEPFWLAVRGNLATFKDAADWWRIVCGEIAPVIEDPAFCATAAELLPPEPFDEETWAGWIAAIKTRTGRKGRALFHPLRLALTGREDGPELARLLPLIGRAVTVGRLTANS